MDIALGMPDEEEMTDEDSDKEDQPDANPSHLGRRTLNEPVEISGLSLRPENSEIDDQPTRKRTKKENLKWERSAFEPTFVSPIPSLSLSKEAEDDLALCSEPVDFFFLLFDEEIQQHIVSESNIYAVKKGISLNLTLEEFQHVVGILLLSVYNKVPSTRLFWSTKNDVRNDLVASTMTRNRFFQIIRHIHCAHEYVQNDKLWKLRPLIQKIQNNFKKYVRMNDNVCVDESMIKYFGHHPMKQFTHCHR